MDPDLIVFIVIILLASKSCKYPFSFPSAVTLRLGRVLKARPVPTSSQMLRIQRFSVGGSYLRAPSLPRFVKKADTNGVTGLAGIQNNFLLYIDN